VDADLAKIERERAELEAQRSAAIARVNHARSALADAQTGLHRTREDVLRLGAAVERRAALQRQIDELVAANEALQAGQVEDDQRTKPAQERLHALRAAREAARVEGRTVATGLEAVLRSLQTHETQLEARERALEEYEARGGAAALAAAARQLDAMARQLSEAEASCRQVREVVDKLRETALEHASLGTQIRDFLSHKRSVAQQEALAHEMDAKRLAAAALGDRGKLQAEYSRLQDEEAALRSDADRGAGALDTVREAANRAAAELRLPQYSGIDAKHRRAMIELKTTEMATSDLERYHKALERALLAFHTTKMGDINKIVKELWQKTYRNSDIDYIAIRADTEGGAAQRSYNYRVVMACGGTELDMRGRCSAGQKVLACLIIRLALAETFCLHCGILALDEPTTNLDADNAASLAEALRAVMVARREQQNFQLVVITHDEAFARHIGTREHAEHMWRITKDEAQHSQLKSEPIE
jgi:DNA repair protein RAD50